MNRAMSVGAVVVALVLVAACGKKQPAAENTAGSGSAAPTKQATPVEDSAEPAGSASASKFCEEYVAWKEAAAEDGDEPVPGDLHATCMKKTAAQTDADRTTMTKCANVCGDIEYAIACYDKFGTDDWPNCTPENEGEDEADGAGADE